VVLFLAVLLLLCANQPEAHATTGGCPSFDTVSATLHVPCLSLAGGVYSFDVRVAKGSYVVTVDGLSFDAFGPGQKTQPASEPPYLWVVLSSPPLSLGSDGIVLFPYEWSRNGSETSQAVDNLRTVLRQTYERARGEGKRFVVLAHSWGTVLTYLALALESVGSAPIVSDLYVTLGSPMGAKNAPPADDFVSTAVSGLIQNYTEGWVSGVLSSGNCPACVPALRGAWRNYWALSDYISGPLNATFSQSSDIQVDAEAGRGRRPGFSEDTTAYWHEFTSLGCKDYCTPGDNLWLLNELKGLIQAVTNGLMLEKVGLGSVPGSSPECATADLSSSVVHLPCLELGGTNWWLDLQALSFEPIVFTLKNYGVNR
jgi:hypothetical protein